MRYTIISIDDSRAEKKQAIRDRVRGEEISVVSVNGHSPEELKAAVTLWSHKATHIQPDHYDLTDGEFGIWFSQLNAWLEASINGDLLILEDDAILADDFVEKLDLLMHEATKVPEWDALALFVPEDQTGDIEYNVVRTRSGKEIWGHPARYGGGNPRFRTQSHILAKAYQGYGCVANYITQAGARKLLENVREEGIYMPVDCWFFEQAYSPDFTILTPRPEHPRLAWVDWKAPSLKAKG